MARTTPSDSYFLCGLNEAPKEVLEESPEWFRLLCLEGGGVRGLSSLYILLQLMTAIDPENLQGRTKSSA